MNLREIGTDKYRVKLEELLNKYESLVPENIRSGVDWEGYIIISLMKLNALEMRYRIFNHRKL